MCVENRGIFWLVGPVLGLVAVRPWFPRTKVVKGKTSVALTITTVLLAALPLSSLHKIFS